MSLTTQMGRNAHLYYGRPLKEYLNRSQLVIGRRFFSRTIFNCYPDGELSKKFNPGLSNELVRRPPVDTHIFSCNNKLSRAYHSKRKINSLTVKAPSLRFEFSDSIPQENHETDEAIRRLTSGDFGFEIDSQIKDFVLVVGNTGFGKTTLTRLLADPYSLEAYEYYDRFLIRDNKSQKISDEFSTIVSKTSAPDLSIDPLTNACLCDLPGFCDTRTADIEISNAYYTKKVFDHAAQVKILIVLSHYSVRVGDDRDDFINCLDHLCDLIKEPARFTPGFALVATKVESSSQPQKIVGGIASFLQSARANLDKVFAESPQKIPGATAIIDALLAKDEATGKYSRIHFFKNPSAAGPLVDIPQVMDFRSKVQSLIHSTLEFVPSSSQDFGISVSHRAKLRVMSLIKTLHEEMSDNVVKVSQGFEEYFTSFSDPNFYLLGTLLSQQQHFNSVVSQLPPTFPECIAKLQELAQQLELPLDKKLMQIGRQEETRQTFQRIISEEEQSEDLSSISTLAFYLQESDERLSRLIYERVLAFNEEVQERMSSLAKILDSQYYFCESAPDKSASALKLSTAHYNLQRVVREASGAKSYHDFYEIIQRFPSSGIVLPPVQDNISLSGKKNPLKVKDWLRPLESSLSLLREERLKLDVEIQDEKHKEELSRLRSEKDHEEREKNRLLLQMTRDQEDFRIRMELERQKQKKSVTELVGALAAATSFAMIFGPIRWARKILAGPLRWTVTAALTGPIAGIVTFIVGFMGKSMSLPVRWALAAGSGLIAWIVAKLMGRKTVSKNLKPIQ